MRVWYNRDILLIEVYIGAILKIASIEYVVGLVHFKGRWFIVFTVYISWLAEAEFNSYISATSKLIIITKVQFEC